jgi:hypothetical protein
MDPGSKVVPEFMKTQKSYDEYGVSNAKRQITEIERIAVKPANACHCSGKYSRNKQQYIQPRPEPAFLFGFFVNYKRVISLHGIDTIFVWFRFLQIIKLIVRKIAIHLHI